MHAPTNASAKIRHCFVSTACLLALLLGGCSSFNRDWNSAARTPISPDSIEGRWEGRWVSAANGHDGRLRCLVTKNADGPYQARFHAAYLKVMRFGYTVPLTVTSSNGVWLFQGDANLGRLAGGVYHYEGTTTTNRFHSTYRAKYDHGHFEMTRPPAEQ